MKSLVKKFDVALPRGCTDESALNDKQHQTFTKNVDSKKTALTKEIATLKADNQEQEDTIQSNIGDAKAKQSNVEHSQKANKAAKDKATAELSSIASRISSVNRISKSEVDSAVKDAENFVKERDELQASPRLAQIPTEIKTSEDKLHSLSRSIDTYNENLTEMRRFSDQESAIEILADQIKKEEETLEADFKEMVSKYPAFEEKLEKVKCDNLKDLEDCTSDIHNRLQNNRRDEKAAVENIKSKQKEVTEISTMLKHNKKTLGTLEKKATALSKKNR